MLKHEKVAQTLVALKGMLGNGNLDNERDKILQNVWMITDLC